MSIGKGSDNAISRCQRISAQRVRQLAQDDDQADTGQHPADHRIRKVIADHTGAQQTQSNLHQAGQEHRRQKGRETTEGGDSTEHNGRESGRRAADHQV